MPSDVTITSNLGTIWDVIDIETSDLPHRGLLGFSMISRKSRRRIEITRKEHQGTWLWEKVLDQLYIPTPADDC